ncbi:helix-turn-helix domain-containing protein [Schinkia sp. CFF1]
MERFRFFLVLFCLNKLNGERTIYAIYHLLNGKKSSQTIQDAKLYKLTPFFQTMQHLSKKDIEDIIFHLETNGYITVTNKDTYIVTEKGYFYLENSMEKYPIPVYLNGWIYQKEAQAFWQRISLTVQTLSFLNYEQSAFNPVINDEDTQHWVKSYLRASKNRLCLATQLYKELQSILKQLPRLQAEIFVLHLSGFHRVGYTIEQIGRFLRVDHEYAFILFHSVLHFIIHTVNTNPDHFRQLLLFIEQKEELIPLTMSAKKTYDLLKQNFSITEITVIRNLKESTIEDHIVEIATEDKHFTIEPFVSKKLQERIANLVLELGTKRLKPIRDALNNSVSYFQIRLVLGRMEK